MMFPFINVSCFGICFSVRLLPELRIVFPLMLHKRKTSQIIRNRKRCSSYAAMYISRCSIVIYFLFYFYLFSLLFVYNW